MPAAVTQFRWDYVMESGIRGTTLALALRLPGDYLPLRGLRGINQHGELAVVEQAQRAEQPTADCDRFSFNRGEGVRKSVADLFWHSLAAKGGNEGRWSDVAQQSADERVPLSYLPDLSDFCIISPHFAQFLR